MNLLHEIMDASLAKHADLVAIETLTQKYTYFELDALIERVASFLRSHPGTTDQIGAPRVALLQGNTPQIVASYLGTIRAHQIVVPCNSALTPNEVSDIIQPATCHVLIYDQGTEGSATAVLDANPSLIGINVDKIPIP